MAKVAKVYDGSVWQDIATNQPDNSNYPTYTSIQFGFRNELINGDFRINQRAYASGSVLSTSDGATPVGFGYSFDRWKATTSGTFLNFVSAPNGQQITISANGSIAQIIERQNITAGTYTLSWTGSATGRVYNVGATAPAYAASPVTVSLDGTANVIVEFTAVTNPQTLNLVQLEQGGRQTAFEYRPIQAELAACQRYYWKSYPQADAPGNNYGTTTGALTGAIFILVLSPANAMTGYYYFPTTMRINPTVVVYSLTGVSGKSSSFSATSMASNAATEYNIGAVASGPSQISLTMTTQGDGRYASAHVTASAEL